MIKSTSNAQVELRMDAALKGTFLPGLPGMEPSNTNNGVIGTTHYCPMCGQQFEHLQHANEHLQLCHGVIATNMGGMLLAAPSQHHMTGAEQHKMDFPCVNCDDKFGSSQELDEHHRLQHQTAPAFLARCLACGIYGFSITALQQTDEYKCMHCGAICNAAALIAAQQQQQHQLAAAAAAAAAAANNFMEQPAAPTTPDELPAIPPQEMNSNHHHQQQQQQSQQQQHDNAAQALSQSHQQQQQQQTDKSAAAAVMDQRRVPPLTVRLNKISNGDGIEKHPQVIIKQEPPSRGENSSDAADNTPTCVPVYTIQQTGNVAPVGSAAAAAAASSTTAATVLVGNKVRHKCADCPKTFKTLGTLAMHRKVHTGEADNTPKERPYICSYCGKSFTQSNTLKQHTRIHTGEKPFQCVYCEKSFSVKDYLTKHIRTHTGEKPYTCPYCEKRFTQRSALTVHTSKLHPL